MARAVNEVMWVHANGLDFQAEVSVILGVPMSGDARIVIDVKQHGDEIASMIDAGLLGLSFVMREAAKAEEPKTSPPVPQGYSRALGWELLAKNLLDAWRETDGTTISPELYFALANIEMFTQQPKRNEPTPSIDDGIPKAHCGMVHPHDHHGYYDPPFGLQWCLGVEPNDDHR